MEFAERIDEIDTGDVTLSTAVVGEGPVIIAVHGFPDCRETFVPLLHGLVGAGYRVVLPALRGYWPSGVARSGRHDALAAGEDILFLADHFSPNAPVRLIGHDWGAVASFAATARRPERFSHLATAAVPHPAAIVRNVSPAQLRRSWYMGLFQLPAVAEVALSRGDLSLIDSLWRAWSPGHTPREAEMAAVKAGIRHRIGPVLAYYRALLSPRILLGARRTKKARGGGRRWGTQSRRSAPYEEGALPLFRKTRVPAIHLHGEDDGCMGIEIADGAERFYERGYSLHPIAGAGHFLIQEKPEEISRILLDFFAR